MKKKLLIIVSLFLCLVCFSQNHNKDCTYKIKNDDFEKSKMYSFENKILAGGLSYFIYANSKQYTTTYFAIFAVTGGGQCLTSSSYVSFMFEDNEVKKIYYTGNIDCGTTLMSITLTKEDLEMLSTKKIKKIRVDMERPKDFVITENRYLKFSNNLKCLLSI